MKGLSNKEDNLLKIKRKAQTKEQNNFSTNFILGRSTLLYGYGL